MKQKISKTLVMLTLITGIICFRAYAQTNEMLSNNDIIKLTKLGLAPATIINKIETTNSNFNVSVDSLVALKKQGVDKDVINEMVNITTQAPGDAQYQNGQGAPYQNAQNDAQYQNGQGNAPYQNAQNDAQYQNGQGNAPYQNAQNDAQYQNGQGNAPYQNAQSAPPPHSNNDASKDPNDPKTWRAEGVYYYNKSNPGNLFVPLDADAISGMKTGGYGTRVAQYYTYGLAKNKQEAVIDGAHSYRQIPQNTPAFYFYFNADNITPGQFVLVNLIQKRDNRVMVVGSSNYYERSKGIDEKERVDFTYDKVADGIYKVYTRAPLKPGEYCFVYNGPGQTPFSNVVYDFGISPQ
jgi:hypothetical protein